MDTLSDSSSVVVHPEDFDHADEKHEVAIIGPQQLEVESLESDAKPEPEVRADDYEVMRSRVLKDLPDLDVEAEAISTWNIEGWRNLPKKLYGPTFECGGHLWKILFFPFGNNVEFASFYLEQANPDKPKSDWYACVHFALVMWNPQDPSVYMSLPAYHRFTAEEGDWGFTRYCEIRKLFAAKWEDKDRPMVEKGSVNMTAYVRIIKDPTGVLWHNFLNYDSKKETGFVGLRNQGATCYLNSLLQSLYFTNAFRKAIYQIPTQDEESLSNSAYTLQRLFYLLQTSTDAVPTNELTRSFGWDSKQTFEQQDVQELSRILMERMESKMKGTDAENALARLFVGKTKTNISCIDVDYESSRVEEFWDIQLTVSGNKNLDDSFRDYVRVETMDGDNRYFAEGYGLQDAKKGDAFVSFPQVLHLQLKRFEYDVRRDATMKVNDRYEFPEIFDVSPYLSADADRSEPYTYQLHGVLVHSGDFNAGHYYAFLKPTKDGVFYKFDDDRVTRATMKEVLEENFGGDYDMPNGTTAVRNPYTRTPSTKRSMSAYMLVYIRRSRLDQVLVDVSREDTPPHLQKRLDDERALREQRRKDREEQHLYLTVGIVTGETFKSFQGFDLAAWDVDPEQNDAAPKMYRVLKTTSIKELTGLVASDLGRNPEHVRLWAMVNRQNKTVRPDQLLRQPDVTVDDAYTRHGTLSSGFRAWAEAADLSQDGTPTWADPQLSNGVDALILLFVKYFDVANQTLRGAGHIYFPRRGRVSELVPYILDLMSWPSETKLDLFEEIKPNMVEPLKPTQMLVEAEIQDGDIVCFQKSLSNDESSSIARTGRYADAREFYEYLCNRLTVRFVPKNSTNRDEGSFDLDLSKRMPYDRFAAKVGEHLKVDPTHLRFFTVNATTGNPKAVVRRSPTASLLHILTAQYGTYGNSMRGHTHALCYEVLDLSLSELETKKSLKVVWVSEGISKEEVFDILVPKISTIADVATAIEKKANLPEGSSERIRIYEVHNNKIFKVLSPKVAVAGTSDYASLYAEMIPEEELQAPEGARRINVFHFSREPTRAHGVPFQFLMLPAEPFKQTKERLEKRMGLKDKQFEKIKFALVPRMSYVKPTYLNDDDTLDDVMSNGDNLLGLDHVDRTKGPISGRGDGIIIR